MKRFLVVLTICIICILPSFAIEDVSSEVYYLNDCIQVGLKNSPVIKDLKYKLLVTGTDVSIAKSNYFPTFSAGVGYWQGFNTDENFDDGYTKRNLPSVGVYINQLIYDFGKTNNLIDMQKLYRNAAEYTFVDGICHTINDIKMKYFLALEARYAVDIAKNNLHINQIIVDKTKELYQSGTKKEIDYINAQVYYSSAKIEMEKAYNAYKIALQNLYNAMYITSTPNIELKKIDTFDYYDAYFSPEFLEAPKGEWHKMHHRQYEKDIIGGLHILPFDLDFAEKSAYTNSPELRALNYTLKAVKQSLAYTKKQYYPSLTGRVGYEFNTRYKGIEDLTRNNNQLNVAVQLGSSINGLQFLGQTKQAEYKVLMAENDIELYKIDLYHRVRKCYINVETAQRQIENAKDKTQKAKKNLELISADYLSDTSTITYLDLQTARQNYNNAKLDYIEQLKNYNMALAELERHTHIHDKEYYEYALKDVDWDLIPKEIKKQYL